MCDHHGPHARDARSRSRRRSCRSRSRHVHARARAPNSLGEARGRAEDALRVGRAEAHHVDRRVARPCTGRVRLVDRLRGGQLALAHARRSGSRRTTCRRSSLAGGERARLRRTRTAFVDLGGRSRCVQRVDLCRRVAPAPEPAASGAVTRRSRPSFAVRPRSYSSAVR